MSLWGMGWRLSQTVKQSPCAKNMKTLLFSRVGVNYVVGFKGLLAEPLV